MPGTGAYNEEKAKREAAELLIDPSSAQFRGVVSRNKTVCGELNGKNRMGAYVGYTRFLVDTVSWKAQLDPRFDAVELIRAEDLCTSLRGNSYSSASSTLSACESAQEQRLAQILQHGFEREWESRCGAQQPRGVYRPPLDPAVAPDPAAEEPAMAEAEAGNEAAIAPGAELGGSDADFDLENETEAAEANLVEAEPADSADDLSNEAE